MQTSTYDDRDFEEEEEIMESGHYTRYTGKIESYDCQCSPEALNSSTMIESFLTKTYTPMVQVPAFVEQIMIKMNGPFPFINHNGLKAALLSSQNGRSMKNAYILLIGMTGAGKSASINFLFGNAAIAEVGGTESVTSRIHEYRIPLPIPELGIQNSELRVIDTPGLGDTRGLEHDAQFLATLEKYLENHEELRDRIPNVVLVFARFNENRFLGEGANFVRMLRGVDFFSKKLFDTKFSNIIIVLTHYMSETNELVKNPWSRIREFQKAVEDYSSFPKPIVVTVAENKPHDEELPMVNNFYKLPNRELYPRNILEKIQQLMLIGGDPIGEAIIRTGFRHPENFNVTDYVTPLLITDDNRVAHYLNILTSANYNVEDTEISKMLEVSFNNSTNFNSGLKSIYPDALPYLQRILNVRNILTKNDIPKTNDQILVLLKQIRQTPVTLKLLEIALGIKAPVFETSLLLTGNCYHCLRDRILPISPYDLNHAATAHVISALGYMIPESISCDMHSRIINVQGIYDNNNNECLKERFSNVGLGISEGINFARVLPIRRQGYNIFNSSASYLTGIKEIRKFKFTMDINSKLDSKFIETVKKLPDFSLHDRDSLEIWKEFFITYGTHVITSAYGGGRIIINLRNIFQTKEGVHEMFSKLFNYADDICNGKYNTLFQHSEIYSLEFQNGDNPSISSAELVKLEFFGAVKQVQDWVESLTLKPKMLETSLKLISIGDIAKRINVTKADQIISATKVLVTTGLVYTKDPKIVEQERIEIERLKAEAEAQREAEEKRIALVKLAEEQNQKIEKARRELEVQRREHEEEMTRIRREREAAEKRKKEEIERRQREIEYNRWLIRLRELEIEKKRNKCLKAGTKILMSNMVEKSIEKVKRGDSVLDMQLKPSRVIAATQWFLGQQYFYGFDEESQFFTKTHLFVGDGGKYYAVSKEDHIRTNPLMEYEDLRNMNTENPFGIFKFEKRIGLVSLNNCTLIKDPIIYQENTPVYFLEVDNPSGTYIANGYVTRHDIPDFNLWPTTIAVLTEILSSPKIDILRNLEYTPNMADKLDELASTASYELRLFISSKEPSRKTDNCHFRTEENINFNQFKTNRIMETVFNSPSFSTFAVSFYAKSGKTLAELFDLQNIQDRQNISACSVVNVASNIIFKHLIILQDISKY